MDSMANRLQHMCQTSATPGKHRPVAALLAADPPPFWLAHRADRCGKIHSAKRQSRPGLIEPTPPPTRHDAHRCWVPRLDRAMSPAGSMPFRNLKNSLSVESTSVVPSAIADL
jgi:hypothetical protein